MPTQVDTTYALDGFDGETTLRKEFPKFRSQDLDNIDTKLELVLDEMLEKKILNSSFLWGSDSYFVTINSETRPYQYMSCYLGELSEKGVKKDFLYCVAQENKTITFVP